jgi:hypothetical protein
LSVALDDDADGERLEREQAQLVAHNDALRFENAELRKTIAALETRISDMEARLKRNPRNSSMPPSAEGLSKPPVPNRAERRAAAKRRPGKSSCVPATLWHGCRVTSSSSSAPSWTMRRKSKASRAVSSMP